MGVKEQTCESSTNFDNSHYFEQTDKNNPYGQCLVYYFMCRFCGAKKCIAIDPSEPFNQVVYWEEN